MIMALNLIHCSRLFRNSYSAVQKLGVISRQSSVTTWNKDWKPGPYPRTEEERRLAAKKYNLIPEDYEPYPEEEGFGDYPKIEPVSAASRNHHETFDYMYLKRNFGEPLHVKFDSYTEERIDVEEKHVLPFWGQFLFLGGIFGILVALIALGEHFSPEVPFSPKQMPYKGQKHYTFEPAN